MVLDSTRLFPRDVGRGGGGSCVPVILLLYSVGESCFALSVHPKEYSPQKEYTLLLISYVRDHAASPRISADTTALKCLASGKKSIEPSHPNVPHSALELLLFCYFHTLLVYLCTLYLWNVNFITCTWTFPPS